MKRTLPILLFMLAACGGDDDDGTPDGCLDAAALDALDAHAESLRFSAAMLAGHPGAREATGFFTFPGLEIQRVAVYAGPLVMECSDPFVYDPYCEKDGLCSQIECTGAGTSWEMRFWIAEPVAADIRYESATVDTAWVEGDTGITVTIASQATGADDRDWSITGTGAMDVDRVDIEETYAGLIDGSVVVLTVSDDSEGNHGGAITIDGEVVAEPDPAGRYTAVEACR